MITVETRYFAAFREQVGADSEVWTVDPCTAGELFIRVSDKYRFLDGSARCKVAVNEELVGWDTPLTDGDTVLFFPPWPAADMFAIAAQPIDVGSLKAGLEDPGAGACVCFEGWVRNLNDGAAVVALDYEAYEPLAVKEGEKVLAEAAERFQLIDAVCQHRVGQLVLGDCAVWVGVTAAHRDAAFAACRFIIDEIKARLPIWKKEHYQSGDSGWVNCATAGAAAGNNAARPAS